MKNWHPDVAGAAEDKAAYNARCAQINAAYDEAITFARAWQPVRRDSTAAETIRPNWSGSARRSPFASTHALVISFMLFFVFASRAGFRIFLLLLSFTVALGFVALLDWSFFRFAIQPVLSSAPDPYNTTAAWLLLAIANIAVLSFGLAEIGSLLFGFIGGGIFDVTVGVAIPLWISLNARQRVCS